jgi:hypothetical protein
MLSVLPSLFDTTNIFPYRGIQRSIHIQILICLLFLATACKPTRTSIPSPSPEVIATAMTAFVVGQVVEEDGCLLIKNKSLDNTLVFPPDAFASVEGDQITFVTGIVTGEREEIVLNLGDWAHISGGEAFHLGEELLNTLPLKCQEPPYWVVGFNVEPYYPTEEAEQ